VSSNCCLASVVLDKATASPIPTGPTRSGVRTVYPSGQAGVNKSHRSRVRSTVVLSLNRPVEFPTFPGEATETIFSAERSDPDEGQPEFGAGQANNDLGASKRIAPAGASWRTRSTPSPAPDRTPWWPRPGRRPGDVRRLVERHRPLLAALRLRALGDRELAARTRRALAGLSQAEVAAHAGTSVAAVKTRLHKRRAGLREQLEPWWKEQQVATSEAIEMRVADVRRTPGEGLPGPWSCSRRSAATAACRSGSARSRRPRWRCAWRAPTRPGH
jgi:hypothetical protein